MHMLTTNKDKKNGNSGQVQTVGHMPDRLAEVLYKPLMDNIYVLVSCRITGQSKGAPGGVWVQGGGIEILCAYEVKVKTGLQQLRKDFEGKPATTYSNSSQIIQFNITGINGN